MAWASDIVFSLQIRGSSTNVPRMKFWLRQSPVLALITSVALLQSGCIGFIPARPAALGAVLPGDVKQITPSSSSPRLGQVILMRGLIGIWSYGIDEIGSQINAAGVHATVFQHIQWWFIANHIANTCAAGSHREPIVIIGHSLGADDAISLCRYLDRKNIPVDLVITIDPVAAPSVPHNVRLAINYYQAGGLGDVFPKLSVLLKPEGGKSSPAPAAGSPKTGVAPATTVLNVNLAKDRPDLREPFTDHFNIDESPKLQQEILRRVLELCPIKSTRPNG